MTSTVNSCKRDIKELEGEVKTLKAENEDLRFSMNKLLASLGEILGMLSQVETELVFNLPPVGDFIQRLREIINRAIND